MITKSDERGRPQVLKLPAMPKTALNGLVGFGVTLWQHAYGRPVPYPPLPRQPFPRKQTPGNDVCEHSCLEGRESLQMVSGGFPIESVINALEVAPLMQTMSSCHGPCVAELPIAECLADVM